MGSDIVYLIDTNILIYYLNGSFPENNLASFNKLLDDHFNVSIITKIELLGFRKHTDDSLVATRTFIENASIFSLTETVIEETILLRRKYAIKLPDCIIAATARINDFALVTRDTRDFEKIDVRLVDPWEHRL